MRPFTQIYICTAVESHGFDRITRDWNFEVPGYCVLKNLGRSTCLSFVADKFRLFWILREGREGGLWPGFERGFEFAS